jgi:RNA polymerase sigma factor (sigma-70 family)
LLVAQATYRLGPKLRQFYDPEDLVNDVWAITLRKLSELNELEGRITPVLLRFMTTTITYRTNDLVKKHAAEDARRRHHPDLDVTDRGDTVETVADTVARAETAAERAERRDIVTQALEELDSIDREVLLLRGIEQNSNASVALVLGLSPNAVSMRYGRALERLRARLPGSDFEELPAEGE